MRCPNSSALPINGEKPHSTAATAPAGHDRVTRRAAMNMHQPDRTGASASTTLNDTVGPDSQVSGAMTNDGSRYEVLSRRFAPPWPANISPVRKGLWP